MEKWVRAKVIPGYAITGDPGDLSSIILVPSRFTKKWIAVVETEEGTIQARYLEPEEEHLLGNSKEIRTASMEGRP